MSLRNVLPSVSQLDTANSSLITVVVSGYYFLVSCVETNCANLGFGKFCSAMRNAFPGHYTPLLRFVPDVVSICAKEKMGVVNAFWVVAFMENMHSIWNRVAGVKNVGNSMCSLSSAHKRHRTITVSVAPSLPFVASSFVVYLNEKIKPVERAKIFPLSFFNIYKARLIQFVVMLFTVPTTLSGVIAQFCKALFHGVGIPYLCIPYYMIVINKKPPYRGQGLARLDAMQ